MLRPVPKVPFSATDYPITVAEVPNASAMLDELLSEEERDELVDCLAFQPDVGQPVEDCVGVRRNVFEFGSEENAIEITVFYFFYDLNMPLYVLATYFGDEEVTPSKEDEKIMNDLAARLVERYQNGTNKVPKTNAGKTA